MILNRSSYTTPSKESDSPAPGRFEKGKKMNKHIGDCIEGGVPPCPLCSKTQECSHGRRVVGKSKETMRTLASKAKMSPSEAGRRLSRLAVAERKNVARETRPWWIKERTNPQTGIYYVPMGQMLVKEARRCERSLYGSNNMLRFSTERQYQAKLKELRDAGENILD